MKNKIFSLIFILFLVGAFLVWFQPALALDSGINEVNQTIDLGSTDPRVTVARVIQIALLFLGAIALLLVIYAGFLWMTSGGQEDKVSQAKNILKNAIIGLIIVLSALGITTFILSRLLGATGASQGIGGNTSGGSTNPGLGAIGACSVEGVYPTPGQTDVSRNTSILISLKEQINLSTVCQDTSANGSFCDCSGGVCDLIIPENVRIYQSDSGDACEIGDCSGNTTDVVAVISPDGLSLALTPLSYLGSSSQKTWYTVYLSNDIEKAEGGNLFDTCSSDYMQWNFEVGVSLDLNPPEVEQGGVFPAPDDGKDEVQETAQYQAATGNVTVTGQPKTYAPANVVAVTKNPIGGSWDNASAVIDSSYHQQLSAFEVVAINNGSQAQLFNGTNLLAAGTFSNNEVVFNNYFTFTVNGSNYSEGSSWIVEINPETIADSLIVGSDTYIFSTDFSNNHIPVSANLATQAVYIQTKLSGNELVEAALAGTTVNLTAKVAGSQGNDIILSSSSSALNISPMSGGVTGQTSFVVNDIKDRPRNSIIQINFNEPVSPVTLSGTSQELSNYIRVVNNDAGALPDGQSCSEDSDCLSYKCQANICSGNGLAGKFVMSNGFKTVEFISDNECGVNGCGETIYCLPGNSNLAVEIEAADLQTCATNQDCINLSPFNTCGPSGLGYNVCQSAESINYPMSSIAGLDGVTDAAANSLNGNRDSEADGPLNYYSENLEDTSFKDSFRWNFYINDSIEINPPTINTLEPNLSASGVDLDTNVKIEFSELMMNSSLHSGSVLVDNGEETVEHKLINLRGTTAYPLGYWIGVKNVDLPPLTNEPDVSRVTIYHSLFSDAMSHIVQVGSGVKDIYQNCYKPSSGPNCLANDLQPSCCFGTAVAAPDCTNY